MALAMYVNYTPLIAITLKSVDYNYYYYNDVNRAININCLTNYRHT